MNKLRKYIEENSLNLIHKSSVKQLFDDKDFQELTDEGYLVRIENGKYRKFTFFDEYAISHFISREGVVSYWTALNYHGLTEQIPNVVYIQTLKQKRNMEISGVRYIFVLIKKEKFIGHKTAGYGNHQFLITDIEKTVVDCFDLPKYGGGYFEIIKGFNNAKLSAQKLVKYCKANNNISAIKRLAYLVELLDKPKMEYFIRYALSVRNEKYSLFESDGDKKGKTLRRWRLILNMDEDEIVEIANS